jgi:hypothetical protein
VITFTAHTVIAVHLMYGQTHSSHLQGILLPWGE